MQNTTHAANSQIERGYMIAENRKDGTHYKAVTRATIREADPDAFIIATHYWSALLLVDGTQTFAAHGFSDEAQAEAHIVKYWGGILGLAEQASEEVERLAHDAEKALDPIHAWECPECREAAEHGAEGHA